MPTFIIISRSHLQRHSLPDILVKLGILTGCLPRFKSYLPICSLRSVSKAIAVCVLGHHQAAETARIHTLHLVDTEPVKWAHQIPLLRTEPVKWAHQIPLLRSALRPFCGNVEEVTLPEFHRRIKSIQKVHHYARVLQKFSPIIDVFAKFAFPQVETQQTMGLLSTYGYDRTNDNLSLEDVDKAVSLSCKSLVEEIGSECVDKLLAVPIPLPNNITSSCSKLLASSR